MSCPTFKVTVSDVGKAMDKVRKAIAGHGSLSGDETKGSFVFSDSSIIAGKYTIKGTYSVDGKAISITNDIQAESKLVTCERVADKMRDWLK